MRILYLGALIIGPVAGNALVKTDETSFITIYLGAAFLVIFAAFEYINKLNEAIICVYNREQLKRGNDGNEFESDSNDWRWKESTP